MQAACTSPRGQTFVWVRCARRTRFGHDPHAFGVVLTPISVPNPPRAMRMPKGSASAALSLLSSGTERRHMLGVEAPGQPGQRGQAGVARWPSHLFKGHEASAPVAAQRLGLRSLMRRRHIAIEENASQSFVALCCSTMALKSLWRHGGPKL